MDTPRKLAPYVRMGMYRGKLSVGFGSLLQEISGESLIEATVRAAHYWMQPRTREQVRAYLVSTVGSEEGIADQALDLFERKPLLVSPAGIDLADRYSRNHRYFALGGADPNEVQERLGKSTVIVLGCGGIGNFVSVALATAGVGRIVLVDDDRIELSNLTRQILFTEDDVDAEKTKTLAEALRARNSQVQVDIVQKAVKGRGDLDELPAADLLVVSADTPGAVVHWANDFAVARGCAMVNVGYVEDVATWGPFVIPGETGCWGCNRVVAEVASLPEGLTSYVGEVNAAYSAPSNGPVNMLSAGGAVLDCLRYLGSFGTIQSRNRRIGLWTHSLDFEYQDCMRNPDCAVCGAS